MSLKRGSVVGKAPCGKMLFEAAQQRFAFVLVGQLDGDALVLVGRGGGLRAKLLAGQPAQPRQDLPAQLMDHAARLPRLTLTAVVRPVDRG